MGNNDSSHTIARPLVAEYFYKNVYHEDTVCEVLNIFMQEGIRTDKLDRIGTIRRIRYKDEFCGISEMGLDPPIERLAYLLKRAPEILTPEIIKKQKVSKETKSHRLELIGDKAERKIEEAIKILNANYNNSWPSDNKWVILEGTTYPDIFIETDKYVFVSEVKNTERTLTNSTTYNARREQLVRHIEGALNYIKFSNNVNREVLSFYILSKDFVKRNKKKLEKIANQDRQFWDDSLQHLSSEEDKNRIKNTYMGYAIWEEIQQKLNKPK